MSEPIDLSAEQCNQVARKLRTLLGFFEPPRDKRGVVAGPSRVQTSFRTAWGWQLEPSSATSDVDDPDGDLNPDDLKPSPGTLPSGIRGKGGHGDPTLAAVLASLGRRDDRDLSYRIMMEDLDTVGQATAKLIADVTKIAPTAGTPQIYDKMVKKPTGRPCASLEQGCPDSARDTPRSSYCENCHDWIDDHDGGVVPKHVIDTRLRGRKYRAKRSGVNVGDELIEEPV